MIAQRRLQRLSRGTVFRIDRSLDDDARSVFVRSRGYLDVDVAVATIGPCKLDVGARNGYELQFAPLAKSIVLRIRTLLPCEDLIDGNFLRFAIWDRNVFRHIAIVG